jgi:hypothetical protein
MSEAKLVITAQDDATPVLGRVQQGFAALTSSVTALGGLAAAAGLGTLVASLQRVVDTLDDIDEAAQGLGIAGSKLSSYQISARAAGVETEALNSAISKFNVKIADAARGDERAVALFKALGISVRDANGEIVKTDVALGQAAERFASYRDGVEKSALAVEAFGRSGAKFIAFLNQGEEGLTRFAGASDQQIAEAARLRGEIDRLSAAWDRLTLAVGGAVASLFKGADFGAESPEQTLVRVNKQIEQFQAKLNKAEQPELVASLVGALEDLERQADDARRAIDRATAAAAARAAAGDKPAAPLLPDAPRGGGRRDDAARLAAEAARAEQERIRAVNELSTRRVRDELAALKVDEQIQEQRSKWASEEAERAQRAVDDINRRLDALRLSYATEEELETERYEQKLADLQEFVEAGALLEVEANTMRLQIEQDYQDRLTKIREDKEAKRLGVGRLFRKLDMESAQAYLGHLSTLMNSGSRKLFETGKAAAIAETVIRTYEAAQKSYAWASSFSGPVGGAVAAGVAIAAGLANVQRIKSTSFGGGGAGGSVAASAVATPGQGTFNVQSPATQVPLESQSRVVRPIVQVTLTGSARYTADEVRSLIEQINDQLGFGAQVGSA